MSGSNTVSITFDLHPPKGTPAPTTSPNPASTYHHRVDIPAEGEKEYKSYYDALRKALADARLKTGGNLTAWRDAVGNRELTKEAETVKKGADGEEEEGEEEAE